MNDEPEHGVDLSNPPPAIDEYKEDILEMLTSRPWVGLSTKVEHARTEPVSTYGSSTVMRVPVGPGSITFTITVPGAV